MKIAVIGSGPAALGVLKAIEDKAPGADITLFDLDEDHSAPAPPPDDPANIGYQKTLHKSLKAEFGFAFPPPKTLFGKAPEKIAVSGKPRIWRSAWRGGLSEMWGGSAVPFSERELQAWPLTRADLDPYYAKTAEVMGISGRADDLEGYFGQTYANRPPLALTPPLEGLVEAATGYRSDEGKGVVGGVGRVALETRPENAAHCIDCGACMTGCSRGSLFSSAPLIETMIAKGTIPSAIQGKVLRLDPEKKTLQVETKNGMEWTAPFDQIYLAAGCAGTTEIAMRSFGLSEGPVMEDNGVYSFPILYTGLRHGGEDAARTQFNLTNLLFMLTGANETKPGIQVQVYPSFEHLWRYYLPTSLWPLADFLGRVFKARLFWGRLYLADEGVARYAAKLADAEGALTFDLERKPAPKDQAAQHVRLLSAALKGSGFVIPPNLVIGHASSSHYGGTLPYGGEHLTVKADGQVAPGVYLVDSSVFPTAPSLSPTFTIMANAWRTADQALVS